MQNTVIANDLRGEIINTNAVWTVVVRFGSRILEISGQFCIPMASEVDSVRINKLRHVYSASEINMADARFQ